MTDKEMQVARCPAFDECGNMEEFNKVMDRVWAKVYPDLFISDESEKKDSE